MRGYLKRFGRRGAPRTGWFVLKERVLYQYAAPEDVCALESLPVLGYTLSAEVRVRAGTVKTRSCQEFGNLDLRPIQTLYHLAAGLFPSNENQLPLTENQLPLTENQLPLTENQLPLTENQVPLTEKSSTSY